MSLFGLIREIVLFLDRPTARTVGKEKQSATTSSKIEIFVGVTHIASFRTEERRVITEPSKGISKSIVALLIFGAPSSG